MFERSEVSDSGDRAFGYSPERSNVHVDIIRTAYPT